MSNTDLSRRLSDEADQCRNDGADDIAALLDEAAAALAQPAASGEPAIHWPQVVAYPGGNGGLGDWVDISTGDGPECVVRYVPAASGEPVPSAGYWESRWKAANENGLALLQALTDLRATAQPAPALVPLTLEQISRIEMATEWPAESLRNIGPRAWGQLMVCVARAIEAAHGITPAKEAPHE